MFTGLIEAVGEVLNVTPTPGGARVRIATPLARELALGDSVAVNGVCLTVTSAGDDFQADLGPETMRVTNLGSLASRPYVNLERPLRADGRLGGHFVQGHVDAVGVLESIVPEADFFWMRVGFPRHLSPYLVHRGSIAVDGISLTVAGLAVDHFDVQLVPFTMDHTNLQYARAGDPVNLECDLVGKYVARAAELAGLSLGLAGPADTRR